MKLKYSMCAVALAISPLSSAQTLLTQGGFEDATPTAAGSWTHNSPSWLKNGGTGYDSIAWANQPTGLDGPWLESENLVGITGFGEGDYLGFLWGSVGNEISQVISTVPGLTYTLSGLIGLPEVPSGVDALNGAIGGIYAHGATSQLLVSQAEGGYKTFANTFTADSASTTISLEFLRNDNGVGAGGSTQAVIMDGLSLSQNVPEPGVALLGAIPLLGLVFRRRR